MEIIVGIKGFLLFRKFNKATRIIMYFSIINKTNPNVRSKKKNNNNLKLGDINMHLKQKKEKKENYDKTNK